MAGAIVLFLAGAARAVDEEGCLFCHRLELASQAAGRDGGDLRVREVTGGAHDALFCSDCHPDARRAPHVVAPGPAQCIMECHGQTARAKESHRRASYGGLSEPHRRLSSPEAPCRLCHRGGDGVEGRAAILERCGSCHPAERASEIRGVHGRLAGRGGCGLCVACHPAHPAAPGARTATCDGPGCHKTVTAGMKRLVGHRGDVAGGRAAEAGVVAGIAALGWVVGRRLAPTGRKGRGAR